MVSVVKASDARQQLSEILNTVFRQNTRVLVERSGIPVAAIVPASDLERLQHLDAERERAFATLTEFSTAFSGIPEEELEREIAKAIAEARAERQEQKRQAPVATTLE